MQVDLAIVMVNVAIQLGTEMLADFFVLTFEMRNGVDVIAAYETRDKYFWPRITLIQVSAMLCVVRS